MLLKAMATKCVIALLKLIEQVSWVYAISAVFWLKIGLYMYECNEIWLWQVALILELTGAYIQEYGNLPVWLTVHLISTLKIPIILSDNSPHVNRSSRKSGFYFQHLWNYTEHLCNDYYFLSLQ